MSVNIESAGLGSTASGRLSLVSVSHLLETMQTNEVTGELHLKTDFGPATVWFDAGVLVDAEIGLLKAVDAIIRVLGLQDGSFEIKPVPVQRPRLINQSVRSLLRRKSQRVVEWKTLVEKLPLLSSVLMLDLQSFSVESESLSEELQELVQLVDGRRAIFEILDASGRDAVEVLKQVEHLIERGLISADPEQVSGGNVPGASRDGESGVIAHGGPSEGEAAEQVAAPILRMAPQTAPGGASRPSSGAETTVGMPVPLPEQLLPDSERTVQNDASPAGGSAQGDSSAPPLPAVGDEPTSSTHPGDAQRAAPPKVQAPSVGRGVPRLGRYEVLSRLGRGGMGSVYLARITGEGGFRRLFAIKVLREHLSESNEASKMLLKEAHIASRMDHPNIVSVVDQGTHEGQPYMVMDYITGCSLDDLLKARSSKASTAAVVQVILDTLAGLHAAHTLKDDNGSSLDVVHHDVSPHNVLVGRDGIARVSDFGVAYVRRAADDGEEYNRGKPAFTAPERVRGGLGDKRSDLFSVGVLLWSSLARTPLFDGDDLDSTLDNVLTMPVPAASRYGHCPASLDAICYRALQRSPAKRYQTAEEMLLHLRRVAASEDLFAHLSEVSEWVRDATDGSNQVDENRLSFLDASRMIKQVETNEFLRGQREKKSKSGKRVDEPSRTIVVSESKGAFDGRVIAKWTAVALGILLLILVSLWPEVPVGVVP